MPYAILQNGVIYLYDSIDDQHLRTHDALLEAPNIQDYRKNIFTSCPQCGHKTHESPDSFEDLYAYIFKTAAYNMVVITTAAESDMHMYVQQFVDATRSGLDNNIEDIIQKGGDIAMTGIKCTTAFDLT